MADPTALPLDPRLQAHLLDLMQTGVDRSARTEPIHQAAMAMAQHMAPDYAQAAMSAPRARTDPSSIASPITTGATDGGGHPALAAGAMAALAALVKAMSGANGSGGKVDLSKLVKQIKDKFFPDKVDNQGRPVAQWDPYLPNQDNSFAGAADPWQGMDFNQWPGSAPPQGNVDTSWSFGGIPGGYGDNPEDPQSAAPDWASLFPQNGGGGGSYADGGSGGGSGNPFGDYPEE